MTDRDLVEIKIYTFACEREYLTFLTEYYVLDKTRPRSRQREHTRVDLYRNFENQSRLEGRLNIFLFHDWTNNRPFAERCFYNWKTASLIFSTVIETAIFPFNFREKYGQLFFTVDDSANENAQGNR